MDICLPPLVYDVGMNNGDDTDYYLTKGYNVVAIDANSTICEKARRRFSDAIAAKKLIIINAGISDKRSVDTFYINVGDDKISTFCPDRFKDPWFDQRWSGIEVTTEKLSDLISQHGLPSFVKIDVEFYDLHVLRDLQSTGLRPSLISVEAQEPAVFHFLVSMGYTMFHLSPGASVAENYQDIEINVLNGERRRYSFKPHSSGPFGDDLNGDWLGPLETMRLLEDKGFGWIDIHAR